MVAPYTGAWIETLYHILSMMASVVAPYTGAWIETVYQRVLEWLGACSPLHGGVD